MKIEQTSEGHTSIVVYAPAIVLIFETEARGPRCSWPKDETAFARILVGLDDEWRDLLMRALEDG